MGKLFTNVVVLSSLISISLFAGCAGNKACCEAGDAAAQKSTSGQVAVINTMCPVGGDDFGSKERPSELARTVSGQNIGFCCEGCVKQFDKMSEEKKAAVLSAATANKVM